MSKLLNIKPFRQDPGLCGPASLKIVLEYYGVKKSEEELAKLCKSSRKNGTRPDNLVGAAKKLGFKAKIKKFAEIKDIEFYVKNKIPVIIDWFSGDDGHYSVVAGIDKKNIYFQDPELDRLRTMDLETFERVWFDFPKDYIHKKNEIILREMIIVYK